MSCDDGKISLTFKRQPHKMVKHTQTIRRKQPTNLNCLSVFDHFVELTLKRLIFAPLTYDLLIFHLEYFCTVKLLTNELFKNELRAFFLEHWEITKKYGTVEWK